MLFWTIMSVYIRNCQRKG